MNSSERISCPFCSTVNAATRETCLACGAPLPVAEQVTSAKVAVSEPVAQPGQTLPTKEDLLEAAGISGDSLDDLYSKGIFIYSMLWRTLAEILVISITAFCIGLAGGATGVSILGILGAIIYGAAVGNVLKSFSWWLVSMLLGLTCGFIVALIFYLFIPYPSVPVLLFSTVCVVSVFTGSQRLPFSRKNLWEKFRPFAGAAGGLAFGILGTTIGWGLMEVVKSFG